MNGIGRFLLLSIVALVLPWSAAQAQTSFNRNLKVGDSGPDVLLLQKTLNLDPWTRIAATGPGSPGNETVFFGARTREAVARFQERYASEVLAPAGLTRGTGFVGSLTRAKMVTLVSAAPYQPSPSIPLPVATTPSSPESIPAWNSVVSESNHNLVNLEPFVGEVSKVQEENNVAKPMIEKVANQIRTDAKTKGDFREEFLRKDTEAIKAKRQANRSWRDILIASFKTVDPFVRVAHAQAPALGGPILYFFPCTCSETVLMYVGPPSPVQVVEYVYGTQGFLSYNLPYARYLMGLYEPGSGATCVMYIGTGCTTIPSEGLISTVVGSSV